MSPETLRRAARLMRESAKARSWHPHTDLAVADWLDAMARSVVGTSKGDVPFEDYAFAVATAYLAEEAS